MLLAAFLVLAAPQPCPATPAPLPAGTEGWTRPEPARAGSRAAQATPLTIGHAVTATLLPTPTVAYAVRPEKPGAPASHGGVFAFDVGTAGRYRVALGAGAWVDVLHGGKAAPSVAHGHGPACSTMRKMVDFDLRPGRYLLQVAGSGTPTVPLMVARLP